ncbi:MAG: site-specific integrase, partial [Dehalococcoidia bacterium]|nr:site-specific integrase [Dehalococcoidia bacterium]
LQGHYVSRQLKAALEDAGLPRTIRFHDLRHTFGSRMIEAGVDVATVGALMGHGSPRVTLEVYAHVLPGSMRAAIEATDALVKRTA